MKSTKRFLAAVLAAMMLLVCVPAMAEEQPDTFIADRTIVVQAYVDDIGYTCRRLQCDADHAEDH